ncbi:unnamed protein product [Protopolystoma xenopodis]|uniref:Uncharacterized protein n=1 Tax=Protopolystoma xenopodis TaxID=117903 RepID=A0A3S5FDV4_9PLAT|nr:unnamed protein product [Protopolystoma xenopodis]
MHMVQASSVADIAYCMILLFSSLRLGELLHPAYRMGSLVLNTSATTPWIYFYAVPELRPFLSRVDISSKANWLFSSIRRRRLNGNSQISSPTQPAKTAEQEVVDASPTLHSATVVTGVQEDKMEPTDGEPADVGLARSIVSLDPASTAIARPEIESQDLQATEEIEILRSEAEYRERLKSITDEEEDKLSEIEEIKEAEHSDGEELC